MKTRKRRAALKPPQCQVSVRKKMELAQNVGLKRRVLEWEKTPKPLAHTQVQAACYLSICMTRGFINVEKTHTPLKYSLA